MKTITPIITYFAANSTIRCKFLIHHQANSIDLPVVHDIVLNPLVKNNVGVSWSKTLRAWYIADVYTHPVRCKLLCIDRHTKAKTNNNKINTETRELVNNYTHCMEVKRYSKSTVESYSNTLPVFSNNYHSKYSNDITNKGIMDVNMHYILKRKVSIPLDKLKLNDYKFVQLPQSDLVHVIFLKGKYCGINVRSCCLDK